MFKKGIGVAGALVMLAAVVVVTPQRGKASDIDQVLVVNGSKKPVPVTFNGASVPVTLGGQPIAVTVTGPPGSSLPIHDVDNPARMPFQDSFSLEIDPGKYADKNESFAVTIPANTRLAITQINVLGEMPAGEKLIGVDVDAFVGGSASGDFVGTTFHGTSPSGVIFGGPLDIWSGDQVASLFADSGANEISLSAFRDTSAGTAHVFVQVYGHVVALP